MSAGANCTSFGRSHNTLPGLPLMAVPKSRGTDSRSWSILFTSLADFVTGRTTSIISVPWKASVPISSCGTWPAIIPTGAQSRVASASAVTVLRPPGPEVTMPTWGVWLIFAIPSRANAKPCSVLKNTCLRMRLTRSMVGMICPPCSEGTTSIPCARSMSGTSDAPITGAFP